MRSMRRFLNRLMCWATRRRDQERLLAEMEEHLAMQTADNIRAGMDAVEARRQAAVKFGGAAAIREAYWDQKGLPAVEALLQDVRFAMRRLVNSPGFTLTTVLTLALGIGATTAVFTLVHAVLLKSLAVANPAELLRVGKMAQCCYEDAYALAPETSLVSYDLYKYFREHTPDFAELAAFSASTDFFGARREGKTEPAESEVGEFVSGNYFQMFGIEAYAGRALRPADDRPGSAPVALMSYRLWLEKYGADPSILGSVFDLNGKPYTVVGITPASFYGDTLRPAPPDFFLPFSALGYDKDSVLNQPGTAWLDLIGRVRPGNNTGRLQAEMRVELKQWLRSHWGEMSVNDRALFPQQTLTLGPGGSGITEMRDGYEHWLQILMTVSGFILMIVCANVANLMLVRGMERRRQTALSIALGARPWALVRQALTESVVLSLIGGAVGLVVAFGGTRFILHFVFPRLGEMGDVPIHASPSTAVLLFTFTVSLLTGISFGIAPALMATRVDPIEALRGAGRSTARAGARSRKALVVSQAALALMLLSASGLLTSALQRLENQNFGFDQDRRIIIRVDPRLAGYLPQQLETLYRRIEDSLSRVPGVSAVALCVYSPLSGDNWGINVWIDKHSAPGPSEDAEASFDRVTPGYFAAIGNSIVRGRAITARDTATSQHVAVINEAFARKFFKKEDAIGRYFGIADQGEPRRYQIVGVAKDARYQTFDLDKAPAPFNFLPEAQHDFKAGTNEDLEIGSHYMKNVVVVAGNGETVSYADLKKALGEVDANLPATWIRPLREQVADVFRQQRLIARVTSFFGVLALLLSSIGLYGVTAYSVGRRTTEIGVRMALGASRRNALVLVLRGAFGLVLTGLLVGLPFTFFVGKFLGAQLYGLSPFNSTVTIIAVVSLAVCGLAAALVPALRASTISPWHALRFD